MSLCKIEKKDGDVFIVPMENVTTPESAKFEKDFRKALEYGADNLVVDLQNVSYIDSTGISLFVATYNTLRSSRKYSKLSIVNANKDVLKILNLMKLERIFTIETAA